MGNVYKHLAGAHNKSKTEYLKMSKTIRNNAYIDEKENEVEEMPPKLQFVKSRPPEEAMQVIRMVEIDAKSSLLSKLALFSWR